MAARLLVAAPATGQPEAFGPTNCSEFCGVWEGGGTSSGCAGARRSAAYAARRAVETILEERKGAIVKIREDA